MIKVFLSYTYKSEIDIAFAKRLEKDLKKWDINVQTGDTMKAGEPIDKEIYETIKNVDFLIVILSKTSKKSDWVNFEMNAGLATKEARKEIVFIPVLIEEHEIKEEVKPLSYIDFTKQKNYEIGLRKLIKRILIGPKKFLMPEDKIINCIHEGMEKYMEKVDDLAERVKVQKHLMSPKHISRKERLVRNNIWVITKNLNNDLYDEDIRESVKANFIRGKRYTYFIPNTPEMKDKRKKYEDMYFNWEGYFDFILLPEEAILPFAEIVIYDPDDYYNSWGYVQIQYPGEERDSLFAELSEANILDIQKFFGLFVNR